MLGFAYFSVLPYKLSCVQHYCPITTLQKSHFNGGFIFCPFEFPAADVNALYHFIKTVYIHHYKTDSSGHGSAPIADRYFCCIVP